MVRASGFVLAGGKSSRMGTDKALLLFEGEPLVARAVRSLGAVCGDVAIAGARADSGLERFGRVIPDGCPGLGPLAGIVQALEQTCSTWNIFLAVDVPFVPRMAWERLLTVAEGSEAEVVMARSGGQPHPLCAVYRQRLHRVLRGELEAGRLKVQAAVAGVVEYVDFEEPAWFRNVNTREDLDGTGIVAHQIG